MNVETRGEMMQRLRRERMAAAPAFLRGGFRPFFFGASAWAVIALSLWLSSFFHGYSVPTAWDALAWHRHEMLFGFVGAVVAGFLLTAIPNWTGRLPIAGAPLLGLFALWMGGRAALLFSSVTGEALAALFDVGFYLALAALAGREVVAAKNRNLPIVGLVLLFGLANGVDHAAASGLVTDPMLGIRAGIALVLLMISLIGGRIIPSFTRNWLAKHGATKGLPSQPGRFDFAVIALTAAALLAWIAAPEARPTGAVLLLAGLAQAARLSRWAGLRAARDPLVLILHIGFAWLPLGLLLLGGSILLPSIPPSAAIHALTGGAMATMILAVMTRATLGHTGRELRASGPTILIYALVTLGAVLRVAASLSFVPYAGGLALAGLAWGGAFLLFLLVYGPILSRPRQGEAG
jgi:uncharacterized protein involved in response to NO